MKRRTTVVLAAAASLAVGGALVQSLAGHAETTTTATTSKASTSSVAAAAVTKPLTNSTTFYVDPTSGPATWVKANSGDSRTATIRKGISTQPMARWYGAWSGDIKPAVSTYVTAAAKKKKTPVLVAYNIPDRDACGKESAGGAAATQYRTWISQFATGIGKKPALVILEPDALADLSCLSTTAATTRQKLLTYATQQFSKKAPNAYVYLDAGNSNYATAAAMSKRLKASGINNVRGFSLNVSNYHTTQDEKAFAAKLNKALKAKGVSTKRYVIDTSRNGKGSNGTWCNPAGRKIGVTSRVTKNATTKQPEARLWIKTPGESDGSCGVAPGSTAGAFDPQIAYNLVKGK
ncbi:glycoside hydrolase family 6 protein [Kineosporia sp. J2-2]|uniref:Glucanase n=1 Tax=Kineosporia corallincola TaxID=2835133 RepID=A0ABS5TBR7_9ACTN|nr:glycoside hydrolase family 6 protein [Kineosporia corallincola]MBT0768522.1 glycoside hydrolase family 6 protein [Kineosporia corallincola]